MKNVLLLSIFIISTNLFSQNKFDGKWVYEPSDYILNIVFATREPEKFNLSKLSDLITFGASPRASINLVLASKAKAFINGRGYVIPEDVKYVAKDILRHRILLSYEAEAEEISSEDIIDQLLQEIPVP